MEDMSKWRVDLSSFCSCHNGFPAPPMIILLVPQKNMCSWDSYPQHLKWFPYWHIGSWTHWTCYSNKITFWTCQWEAADTLKDLGKQLCQRAGDKCHRHTQCCLSKALESSVLEHARIYLPSERQAARPSFPLPPPQSRHIWTLEATYSIIFEQPTLTHLLFSLIASRFERCPEEKTSFQVISCSAKSWVNQRLQTGRTNMRAKYLQQIGRLSEAWGESQWKKRLSPHH